jgi:hypothetical protein
LGSILKAEILGLSEVGGMTRVTFEIRSFIVCVFVCVLWFGTIFPFSTSAVVASTNKYVIGEEETVLWSIADSYVDSETPSQNFGSENLLETKNETSFQLTYIMFVLSDIPSGSMIAYAQLIIGVEDMSGEGPMGTISISTHYCQDDSWLESGITWNTKPDFASNASDSWGFSMVSFAETARFDISEDVQTAWSQEKKLTEVIAWGTGSGSAKLYSREQSQAERRPKLIVGYLAPPFYTVSFESALDSGESENMGYISISKDFGSEFRSDLPVEVYARPTNYNVTYAEGYGFLRWETSGGVSVSNPSSKTTELTVGDNGTLKAVGSSSIIEYGYDSGAGEAVFEEVLAVKFTPLFSGYLRKARFYFVDLSLTTTENDFNVSIMDDNRVNVTAPLVVRASLEDEWLEVDLASFNVTVYKGVDFYVGIEKTFSGPSLGADHSKPDGKSWRAYAGSEWYQTADMDYMIRAVVERAEVQPPPAPSPILDYVVMGAIVAVIVAVIVAGVVLRSRRKHGSVKS